jgi:hypothetical protein
MSDRRDLPGRWEESAGLPTQGEGAAAEKPGGGRDSVIGRLPKFFGWWLVIAGISSYV